MSGIGIRPLGGDDPKRLGQYRLLWRLTTGGMGRIYLARSLDGGPLVAVKTLLAQGVVSEPDRKRFAREVELARRVRSDCTVRLLDADARARQPWMAIDYVPAPSLGDLVRAAGPLPPPALPGLAAGTVQALLALHDKGVVHRDVKPQNILLPLTGPLVIDFGISHAIDKTTTSLSLGTIDYTSPEQALGRRSTQASDVFSLGATLFHLAVGRSPYPETDDGPLQRLARVQAGTLDLTGLPAELSPLIRPCLAFEPEGRPTLEELLLLFLDEADRASAWHGDEHRLPVRWTALIDAYEAHGRALDTDSGGVLAMADEHTHPLPPSAPTLLDPREREARRAREEQARQERERRDRELRDLAAGVRARAAGTARQAAEAAGTAEASEAAAAERRMAEQRGFEEREAAQHERERHEAERQRTAALLADGRGPESWEAGGRGADRYASSPGGAGHGESTAGAVLLVLGLVVALLVWHPWTHRDGTDSATGPATGIASGAPLPAGGDGKSSDDPNGKTASTATDPATTPSDSSGDAQDGGPLADTTPPADPSTTTPAADPTEAAFKAVPVGACLPVYDTGSDGGRIVWDVAEPPGPVACDSQTAGLVQVTSRTDGTACPSAMGEASWSYTSPGSGDTTRLCVTRVYLPHYCVLGKDSGGTVSIGPMTVVDCSAQQIPPAYNQVMYIAGVYQAPSGADAHNCAQGAGDRTQYWAWLVDGGRTLLCTTTYQGS